MVRAERRDEKEKNDHESCEPPQVTLVGHGGVVKLSSLYDRFLLWIGFPRSSATNHTDAPTRSAITTPAQEDTTGDVNLPEADAPHWPTRKWNGHYTLHHGVWVDDFAGRLPSKRECEEIRRKHAETLRGTERVTFTLVEGDQWAPLGKDGAMVHVRVTQSYGSGIYNANGVLQETIPTVHISRIQEDDDLRGWWGSSHWGTLPMTISVRRPTAAETEKRVTHASVSPLTQTTDPQDSKE